MKAFQLVVASVVLYSLGNFITDNHLRKINPSMLIVITNAVTLVFAVGNYLLTKQPNVEAGPELNKALVLGAAVGLLIFFADYAFYTAYNLGGKTIMVTTVLASFPAVIALLNLFFYRRVPTFQEIIGFGLVAVGLTLVSYQPPR